MHIAAKNVRIFGLDHLSNGCFTTAKNGSSSNNSNIFDIFHNFAFYQFRFVAQRLKIREALRIKMEIENPWNRNITQLTIVIVALLFIKLWFMIMSETYLKFKINRMTPVWRPIQIALTPVPSDKFVIAYKRLKH